MFFYEHRVVLISLNLEETCHVCRRSLSDGCAHLLVYCQWFTGAVHNKISCCKNKKICINLSRLRCSHTFLRPFLFPAFLTLDCQCLVRQCMVEQSHLVAVVYVIELVTIDDRWNSLLPIIDGHGGNVGNFPAVNVEDDVMSLAEQFQPPIRALNTVFPRLPYMFQGFLLNHRATEGNVL